MAGAVARPPTRAIQWMLLEQEQPLPPDNTTKPTCVTEEYDMSQLETKRKTKRHIESRFIVATISLIA